MYLRNVVRMLTDCTALTSQKIVLFIVTGVRISDGISLDCFDRY
jgi:hypothetical protein